MAEPLSRMDSAESRARRDRDWQVVVVGVSLVAMLIFEMFTPLLAT
jgi:hypothetical protein